jgi:stage V sporulation protein D (sporulation-specific penicillin-binding protein)
MKYTGATLKHRVRFFFVIILAFVVVLTGRLAYVQLFTAQSLRLLAAEQWYRDLPVMAKRGNIYDRNGILMAQSTLTYSLYVRPVSVKNPEAVATLLSTELKMPYDFLYQKVTSRTVSEHLIKMQIEKDVILRILGADLDGIFVSQTYRRDYPLGATASQVLGIVSVDNRGQEGVEAYYDAYIRGIDGRSAVASDLRGRKIDGGAQYYTPSVAGADMHLNIDAAIQRNVQDVAQRAYEEQRAKGVSVLVMDIPTGQIVASAAAPFYDLNNQPRGDTAQLLSQIKNLPLINVLEPGSTFKILTLAIAVEEGLTTETERFSCPGFRVIAGERVKCWRSKGHSTQTLAEGVMQSCNCVFMDLAMRIGVDKYYEYLAKFGIGKKSGVDAFAEPSGLLLNKKFVRPVDLARIGFGQAIAVSPVQFQSAVNAIVGDGILKTPRLVDYIDGNEKATATVDKGRILSQQTCDRVREMLYGVVTTGSGKHAGVSGFAVGGKTGTAQKYNEGIIDEGKYISSFLGFLSVGGSAKYSVYFMCDEPSANGYYGSVVAAPYVGQIFDEMVECLGLERDPNIKAALIPEWGALPNDVPKMIEMPDINGMETYKAVAKLQSLGFFVDVEGDGYTANGSVPKYGSLLRTGAPVVVLS